MLQQRELKDRIKEQQQAEDAIKLSNLCFIFKYSIDWNLSL